jgi:hypothetical protein
LPVHGYITTLDYPWEIQPTANGAWDTYDPGNTYDARFCECEFVLNDSEQNSLMDFLSDSSKAREDSGVTMRLPSGGDFRPFGPDKGNGGPFTVGMELVETHGIQYRPWLQWRTRVRFTNHGAWPSYTNTTDVDEGSWGFGSVTNVRFPPDWFKPQIQYAVHAEAAMDGAVDFVDRGSSADRYQTAPFRMVCNQAKAERIIGYIDGTARAGTFSVTTAANHYIFGYSKGSSGTHTVRLVQNRIQVTHVKYNRFDFELQLGWVS